MGMRICGVMVVRNEEDIVEASVRHNLRVVDALTVIDHASTDATPAILASLAAEGLPIEVLRDDSIGFLQADLTTTHARRLLSAGADLCIPIDADEFVRMPSREAFERFVASTNPARHLVMPWLTYAPDFDAPGDIVAKLAHPRRKSIELHGVYKVIVRRSLLDSPGAIVDRGNHRIAPPGKPTENAHVIVPGDVAAMAHVPVRSVEQYTAKVVIGYLSRLFAPSDSPATSFHFREAYESILAGNMPARDRLVEIAANYAVPAERRIPLRDVTWIEDPFLADVTLRYTPARTASPLAQVLAFGERVAAEVARTTGGA